MTQDKGLCAHEREHLNSVVEYCPRCNAFFRLGDDRNWHRYSPVERLLPTIVKLPYSSRFFGKFVDPDFIP